MSARALIAVLALAAPAAAQEPAFSPAATEACLLRAHDSVACIGVSAQLCIATPEGYSNVGRSACYRQELAYWDARLAATNTELLEGARVSDATLPEESTLPRQGPSIRALHQSFLSYRDAFCTFEYSTWGGGSGAHSAVEQCRMTLTGMQVLLLERGFEVH